MLYLPSPAKSLDYDTPTPAAIDKLATEPRFIERSAELIGLLRQQRRRLDGPVRGARHTQRETSTQT